MEETMVGKSKLAKKGAVPKTEKRRKSDEIIKRKKESGIKTEKDEDCDWTVDGSPSIELPDLEEL